MTESFTTDKASVAMHDDDLWKLWQNTIPNCDSIKIIDNERAKVLAFARALSPSQGDGMRDALVWNEAAGMAHDEWDQIFGAGSSKEMDMQYFRIEAMQKLEKAFRAKAALASHPDHQPGMTDEWQDIETAPRDGTPILLFARHISATASIRVVGHYDDSELGFGWIATSFVPHGPMQVVPSHWQPLPDFPAAIKFASQGG